MNPNNIPFEVGIEQEFFLVPQHHYWTILNARKEMERKLGFSIDQNYEYGGSIKINPYCDVVTDGTAMEYRGFFPVIQGSNNNFGNIAETIKRHISSLKFLEDYRIRDDIAVVQSPLFTFQEPNNIFASEKECFDAYTGERIYQQKKEEVKEVTLRTAGLHIHFSLRDNCVNDVFDRENRVHANTLVRIFDEIFKTFFHLTNYDKKRIEVYQKYGIYRIRSGARTKREKPTLEYRQLSCWHLHANLDGFLTVCAMEAYKYLKQQNLLKKK